MHHLTQITAFSALSLFALTARADMPPEPPPPSPCATKSVGDSCGPAAICKEGSCCTKKHVSATIAHYESQKPIHEQDMDIISPPETCRPCLVCEAQTPGPASTPAPTLAPAPAPEFHATPAPAPAPTPEPAAAPSGGACTIDPHRGDPGALGLSLLLGGLLLAARPRRATRPARR
jgi:hypothetical protein